MLSNRFSDKEPLILLWVIVPYITIINSLMFGSCAYASANRFVVVYGISALYTSVMYLLFGAVAYQVKKRLPHDSDLFRRMGAMLILFSIMNVPAIHYLYFLFEKINPQGCLPARASLWWVVGFACLSSAFITFINEAAAGWERWKQSLKETTRLQHVYQKSRLVSLKRQMNPHFLFNCFNTLSSLIQEDESEADYFLNELTKLYRYLLKSHEEPLVSLTEELKFVETYLYLNRTRFGSALRARIIIDDEHLSKQVAPLSLQSVIENIIEHNLFSKANPLVITIESNEKNYIGISNNRQPKSRQSAAESSDILSELTNKYKLICNKAIRVSEDDGARLVCIPLIESMEVMI